MEYLFREVRYDSTKNSAINYFSGCETRVSWKEKFKFERKIPPFII